MELQIQDLVSSIKREGIDAARAEADRIIAQAKEEAAAIKAQAQAQAELTAKRSAEQAAALEESTKVSAQHAVRDAVLSFKSSVQAEFKKILAADVNKTMQGDALVELIGAALADEDPSGYTVQIAEVEQSVQAQLAQKLQNGMEIKVSRDVRSGFRLAANDGSGYFDCTDEEITEMLMPFFSNLNG